MGEPYIGEIRIFAGLFAPVGWAFCDGAAQQISENDALFSLIGTTYGGDGESTFNLPDLRGRLPLHWGTGAGSSYTLAEMAGVETVTLTTNQLPVHNHTVNVSPTGSASTPGGSLYLSNENASGNSQAVYTYAPYSASMVLANQSIGPQGGNQPHTNIQPCLGLNFIISLYGIYPSPT